MCEEEGIRLYQLENTFLKASVSNLHMCGIYRYMVNDHQLLLKFFCNNNSAAALSLLSEKHFKM